MTTENARTAILKSTQQLFEQSGRAPTVEDVRLHCGCAMRDVVPVVIDWIEAQHNPRTTNESPASAAVGLQYMPLLKLLGEAIEQMVASAVSRTTTRAARDLDVRGLVLDSVVDTCDKQFGEIQSLQECLTVADSAISSIRVTAIQNERDAACREVQQRQVLSFEQTRYATAVGKIDELDAAAKSAYAVAESRKCELTEARTAMDSQVRQMSIITEKNDSLVTQIAAYEKRENDLRSRLAELLDFKESINLLCQKVATLHEPGADMRADLDGKTVSRKPPFIEPGRPKPIAKRSRRITGTPQPVRTSPDMAVHVSPALHPIQTPKPGVATVASPPESTPSDFRTRRRPNE